MFVLVVRDLALNWWLTSKWPNIVRMQHACYLQQLIPFTNDHFKFNAHTAILIWKDSDFQLLLNDAS